eukprot:TRINITY_DN3793_c0_g1_i9.p1 TRINITY_DN3793_c0_g1~~TRINITY_DN3793_c0_g1_i9.p1  ORF type:complete len:580 (-),score=97.96 TRINITY_DN3793_c0_g1_i9:456-2195(-)
MEEPTKSISVGLEQLCIFRDCDETTLRTVEALLQIVEFEDGEYICSQGDPATEMFFLSSGQVNVINSNGQCVATIGEGEFFGEMGLVFSIPRTATIQAVTHVVARSLSKEDFNQARVKAPSIESRVQEIAKFRFARFREELALLAHTSSKAGFTQEQTKVFQEVFSFWDRNNDGKLTKEETGEMMEVISGKKWIATDIDQVIRMLDNDRDGVISYDDFRTKIWNLRWLIEPSKTVQINKPASSNAIVSPESIPFWGRHWSTTGCGHGAQYFLSKAFLWIEDPERVTSEGLYRVSGKATVVEAMKQDLISAPMSIFSLLSSEQDVHNITNLIKLYFRDMPEPLFPFDLYTECISAARAEGRERKEKVILVINHLPDSNRRILKILMRHLNMICSLSSTNLMTSKNMSIVFGPTLLRPLVETQETLLGHAESVTQFLQLVIEKHSKLLSDDNMIGFVPTLTVTPHLSHEVPSTFEPSKTLGKKKTTKSPASVPKKTHAAGPKERGSSSLPPIAISFQASPDDRTELHKLFNHMQTESKTWSHSKALLAYKEIILSIKLAGTFFFLCMICCLNQVFKRKTFH